MKNKLIIVGLNEINFEFIKEYVKRGELPFFKQLLQSYSLITTTSESEYNLLEPWIQWVTIQTGKTFAEHKIFRLGDIVDRKDLTQIFERVEAKGKKVGAISPFNAENRLSKPNFFIPDPWTNTRPHGNSLLVNINDAIKQAVNENAQSKISIKSLTFLALGFLIFASPKRIFNHYLKLFKNRKRAGVKSIILDSLLSDIFIKLTNKAKSDFSWLFLNSGAHIQHHYLFNSSVYKGELSNPLWYCEKDYDPLLLILKEYDNTLKRISKFGGKLIVLTGLHQQPHNSLTFYWRLNRHKEFIKKIGISNFKNLLPRMSRDFLIEFETKAETRTAERILSSYSSKIDNQQIFSVDNRGLSLFVELTYPNDIKNDFSIISSSAAEVKNFRNYISFVAIKNGEHNGEGYLISNFKTNLPSKMELKNVHDFLLDIA